ncbi:Crp/Fnr family transcriptional regulator [Marinobacter zhejiangensis]|uniref:cAMP-binding domain of CRP or a regulatory subunit of cAMP-dependent protein kinases n=1 Tax=Marinobacter zhejiangensis TaxID=488535 RepID=A0A1I4SXG8_9GAMM|nr:Crp/Fnr family transcriptional regulator [Marinobacter zhejiangensis]SFM69095.1 cAMP-binding domain of CRP or a regulatory subunit of cAMP-dependent protein kinases [Marinobacter zhejiangensis]
MGAAHAVEPQIHKPILFTAGPRRAMTDDLKPLREHALFREFDDDDFDYIVSRSRRVALGHHQLLYHQDMPAQHFYFVLSGRLRLYRLDASGVERTLDSIAPGDCFAEVMIYAEPARYACYAEALCQGQVLVIPIKIYQQMLEQHPEYARSALRHYASRAVSRFHELEIMTVQNARDRLVRYLIDLLPENCRRGIEVELPLPKCLVASRLAMQPETFSRILAELKNQGLVRVNRSRVFIPDPMRLVAISQ